LRRRPRSRLPRRARIPASHLFLHEQVIGEVADAGQDPPRLLAVDEADAVALLQRHRDLQRIERVEREARIRAEDRLVCGERRAFQLLVGRFQDERGELGDQGLARAHARRRRCSQNAAASNAAASTRSLRQGRTISAADPCRRITAWKPSSDQAIGESDAQVCIDSGMTKRGTMMPPSAAARMLPTPPVTVACSMVREATATSSPQPIAARLVLAATAASRSQREGRASDSPPSQGTSVTPAASISAVCARLMTKNGPTLPSSSIENGTRWLTRRARVPSRRSTMNSAEIGSTTKNMPKMKIGRAHV